MVYVVSTLFAVFTISPLRLRILDDCFHIFGLSSELWFEERYTCKGRNDLSENLAYKM